MRSAGMFQVTSREVDFGPACACRLARSHHCVKLPLYQAASGDPNAGSRQGAHQLGQFVRLQCWHVLFIGRCESLSDTGKRIVLQDPGIDAVSEYLVKALAKAFHCFQ